MIPEPDELCRLSAVDAADQIARGEITSQQLVESLLERIARRDDAVSAWAWIDPDAAIRAAERCDQQKPIRPLHGVPVGIKDVIDTADMPTAYGSPIYANNRPTRNATCITRLREAGAIILGKTVTAEFATYHPGPTANPHDSRHTPGGSSSGSAAAVADFQVPLALGTQTAGSMIRPASYCGIVGFKPSRLRYDSTGVLDTATTLDTLGCFARDVRDVALVDAVLATQCRPIAPQEDQLKSTIGICRTPVWEEASNEMQSAWMNTADKLSASGFNITEVYLGPDFATLHQAQAAIHAREAWELLGHNWRDNPDQVSEAFAAFCRRGKAVNDVEYQAARDTVRSCQQHIQDIFRETPFLLTPGATGTAPEGLQATGDPSFNRIWTALGTPCLGFRAASGSDGLPIGLQLIAAAEHDTELLNPAQALTDIIFRT